MNAFIFDIFADDTSVLLLKWNFNCDILPVGVFLFKDLDTSSVIILPI